MEWHLREAEKLRQEELKRPFEGLELHTASIKKSQADFDNYILGRHISPPEAEAEPEDAKSAAKEAADEGINPFLVKNLKESINCRMCFQTAPMLNNKNSVPMVIGAAIETLLDIQNVKSAAKTNELQLKTAPPRKKFGVYQKQFPPGTIGFTFPRDDKTKQPDHYYSQVEGKTIYLVGWELNVPGIFLKCPCCKTRELIHQKYNYRMSRGFATALQGIEGETDWAVSMKYKCNKRQCLDSQYRRRQQSFTSSMMH